MGVIIINVPRANYKERPIFLNENPYKGTYKRNEEGDYQVSLIQERAAKIQLVIKPNLNQASLDRTIKHIPHVEVFIQHEVFCRIT